jgi:hypothetical protein
MVENGKHHTSIVGSIAAVLLTRIAACLRRGELYTLRNVDGILINARRGCAIVKERWNVSEVVRNPRRNAQR